MFQGLFRRFSTPSWRAANAGAPFCTTLNSKVNDGGQKDNDDASSAE
jgi:hypothetical protein